MAMATTTYFRSAPLSKHVESRELNILLYTRQPTEEAPEAHENGGVSSGQPKASGDSGSAIYDGPGSDANLVARAQGVLPLSDADQQAQASLVVTVSIEFVDERLKGSTLTMVGNCRTRNGEWAVVGGTGEFGFAHGVATWEDREELEGASIRELRIHCVSLAFPKKMFGGPGGFNYDTPTVPRRLESVTIQSDEILTSIAFSYIDQDGQLQKAGPWGFAGANSNTIQFAPTETIKKIEGTTEFFEGVTTIVTSLSIITNVQTYGPFGRVGDTAFSSTTKDTDEIVGIFVRAGHFVDAVGFHVRSK